MKSIVTIALIGVVAVSFFVFTNGNKQGKDEEQFFKEDNGQKHNFEDNNDASDDLQREKEGGNVFQDAFEEERILEEASEMTKSESENWWLNSGAYFVQKDGVGRTLKGSLGKDDEWRRKYGEVKSNDTNEGYNPQNIFRLITRSQWKNFSEEVYVKITDTHKTKTEERDESNGVLLFGRYSDQNNLYYAGIRVDGQAVIKKKLNGVYETLAIDSVYKGKYDREDKVNLIPQNEWIGLRMVVQSKNGVVGIKLFMDKQKDGQWEEVLRAVDNGDVGAVLEGGYAGIRTDFMDVEFDDYKIESVKLTI